MGKFCEGVGQVTGQLCDVTSQCNGILQSDWYTVSIVLQ